MGISLPYLNSYKNLATLLEKIAVAKVPDTFSQTFMATTLGLKNSTDRPLIPMLRTLGVLDSANKPTPRYHLLRNRSKARAEFANAIRQAYRPLFDADENANAKTGDELKGLVSQVAGTDEDATKRIALTFGALVRLADFNAPAVDTNKAIETDAEGQVDRETTKSEPMSPPPPTPSKLRPEFHYNIQVHLPSNGTEETYLNIFSALRRVFQ